jgi:hypothetical protein
MSLSKTAIFGLSSIIVGLFYTNTKAPVIPESVINWSLPHDALRLDQVHFVGAHNALISRKPTTRWGTFLYAQQTWNLHDQLKHGVRVFELDLGAYRDKLVVCHQQCGGLYGLQKIGSYESFAEIMHCFSNWLDEHPQEIIILLIDSRDPAHGPNMIDNEVTLLPNVRKHILTPMMWNPDAHDGCWPTLKWMRHYNKRLVIFNDRLNDSRTYTFHHWSYVMCTPPHRANHEDSTELRSESIEHNKSHAQLYQLNHFAGIADARIALICTIGSTLTGEIRNSYSKYRAMDNNVDHIVSIIDYGKKKSIAKGKNPNFIMLDNVDRFISNNGLALINQLNGEELLQLIR